MMSSPIFSAEEIETLAHPSVVEAGRALVRDRTSCKKMSIVGADIIATFRGKPDCIAVISRKGAAPLQSACTCGFGYGGACEHAVAAMLAANSEQAIQIGLDLGAPEASDTYPDITLPQTDIETIRDTPHPRLYLTEQESMLLVELRFSYLGGTVEFFSRDRSREKLVTCQSGKVVWLERSMARELSHAARLRESGLTDFRAGTFTPLDDPAEWVRDRLPKLSADGFEVYGRESLVAGKSAATRPTMKLSVSAAGNGLVDCSIDVAFEGVGAHLDMLYDSILAGKKYVRLSDGSTGEIPPEWIEKLSVLFALCESRPHENVIRMRESSALAIRTLESIVDCSSWEGTRASGLRKLRDYEGPTGMPVPQSFKGTLRPYQQAGFEWFYFLREFGINGCLADDMGLGKTIQALSLLLREKELGTSPRTSLLIVPTSLLFNWQREARSFGPALLLMNYHGHDRKRYRKSDIELADVVLTTYGTIQREIDLFKTMTFNYIILDEAQAIKNPLSQTSKIVRQLASLHRLALSGTPIENNLSELWSLFTFLNPGMLGPYSRYAATFLRPIEKERCGPRAQALRAMTASCILRRTKAQVAKELPPKSEIIIKVPMASRQRTLYDMTKDACRASVMQAIDAEGFDRSRMHVLAALTRLRQICCHPVLVDPSYKGSSCKFEAFDTLLENILGERHKALVFSQFVSVLDLLRGRLDEQNIRYEYLTGGTSNRRRPVDSFQDNPDIPLMLISLKAGGVGLNLTAADYVVLFDPWWNPAVEHQAADRAHRIGQTKPVFVYKMIAQDSVEERVMELQQSKRELFDAIITSEPAMWKEMKREELQRLFE